MKLEERVKILSRLGKIMSSLGKNEPWSGYDLGVNEEEYNRLQELMNRVHIYNGWFTPDSVRSSLNGISAWLTEPELMNWVSSYPMKEQNPRKIGIIMAGNIPLVGFHDFVAVFMSGNKALVKLSSDDQHLFPAFVHVMKLFQPEIDQWITFAEGPMREFDAVIATGSDNSSNYFQSYFAAYPNIIRKNRTSVAVIRGNESEKTLKELGNDIFTYFGLGCRNVTHLLIPADYDLDIFFKAIYDFNPIINHNKYANNYDYNKAVYLMNKENLLDNGFLLLKDDERLQSPLGMLFYSRYQTEQEVQEYLTLHKDKIQAIIGEDYIPFGAAQCPGLKDYADGVDTMNFLLNL